MYNFRIRRRWAKALGYHYKGHLRGLGKLFFYEPLGWHRWLLALSLVIGLSGCGASATSGTAKTVAQQQTVKQLTIALERPEQPPLLTEQPLTITLTDASGAPIDGAAVWIGMLMPTMQMSPNEPDAVAAGNGRYRASVLYTMAGTWNLEVHATVKGQEYIATFHTPTA